MTAIEKTTAPIAGLAWLQTLRGYAWHPEAPERYPYDLNEIARVLARIPRFGAHTQARSLAYSVAQHSVLVAWRVVKLLANDELGRGALLHDAPEAFVLDMPEPLKALPALAGYRAIHDATAAAVLVDFGLPGTLGHPLIKQADRELLATERRDLMNECPHAWAPLPEPLPMRITVWDERAAYEAFIEAWRNYGGIA